jgi:flagellar biosynthesis/type III secretory pathway chaperone
MNFVAQLRDVVTAEAQLSEGLVSVLQLQQEALVRNDVTELQTLVDRSEELMHPMVALERERERLSEMIMGNAVKGGAVRSDDLVRRVGGNEGAALANVIRRLRVASREIVRINDLNRPLLEHAQAFIRQTLRAATDDYRKNLIDRKF